MNKPLVLFLSLSLVTVASIASADEPSGSVTLPVVKIVGRVPRPNVTIDVARARPEIKLRDLNDPAVEKVLRAGEKSPF